ncbi:MAG: hypothetical protein HOP12_13740 [Candidatus Eisenbacteria bacterium]|uniref:Zn-dependent metallo-hydrolase RNA specificity domain-containing protein n=1 Tax=Eiseniibacteriota bacterium TaxID=2212470 RepID=A0A849SRF1_UNCEI|nr:hypothetical protein [Candidatus Eisenbacteria bacterium]
MLAFDDGVHVLGTEVWLDPRKRKPRAIVTHAHSDHVGRHACWVTSPATGVIATHRWQARSVEPHPFHEPWDDEGARLTLLPAGHILGSSMVLIERAGTRLLYTGDFRLGESATAEPCVPVAADVLVMECTFGEPRYRFPPRAEVLDQLCAFIDAAFADDVVPVLLAYALGKSQELARLVSERGYPVALWGAAHAMLSVYRELGVSFGSCEPLDEQTPGRMEQLREQRRVVIVPPQRSAADVLRSFPRRRTAFVSGWAIAPHVAWRPASDAAFAISDHADFDGLIEMVERVKPRKIFTLHGPDSFAGELRQRGWDATPARHANQLTLL